MLRRILHQLGIIRPQTPGQSVALPTVDRADIVHVFRSVHGLPQIDWGAAEAWMRTRASVELDQDQLRRAIAAVWLDELRDALTIDHRRWRAPLVEGLAPLDGTIGKDLADAAERSLKMIVSALAKIRGDAPIPPIAIIGLATNDDYYSLLSHFYPDEGEWGTSGGIYIRARDGEFPFIALPLTVRTGAEHTIAHELTHHLLADFDMPQWVEEGLTQMMEERVTGSTSFVLNRDLTARHRRRWAEVGLDRFWSGEAFHSPHDDEQELAYHLAQALTRGLLADRPAAYFAFARSAREADGGEAASVEHLGETLAKIVERVIGPGEWI